MRRWILLPLLLAGCAPATPLNPAPASPTSAGPSAAPSAVPSAAPSAVFASSGMPTTTLQGSLYDDQGNRLDTGRVHVRSLSPSVPFDAQHDVAAGHYEVPAAPVGVQLEVTASRDGWTPSTRLVTLAPGGDNRLDFGAPATGALEDAAYALSDYPEVSAVEPAPEGVWRDPAQLTYVLTLSEPLDELNRARFAKALRILPASAEAAPGMAVTTDLVASPRPDYDADSAPYMITSGGAFLEERNTATLSWDASGRVATLAFRAPLIRARSVGARYQAVLASGGPFEAIVDAGGLQLGTDAAGDRTHYPRERGQVVQAVFRKPSPRLSAEDLAGGPLKRWMATHDAAVRFSVPDDAQTPTLQGVALTVANSETRIVLTFSEPMAALGDKAAGYFQPALKDPSRYSFAIGETADELAPLALHGENPAVVSADTLNYGDATSGRTREFRLQGTPDHPLSFQVDAGDPRIVNLVVETNPRLFAPGIRAIKARVEGVADPAGNAITREQADANVRQGGR